MKKKLNTRAPGRPKREEQDSPVQETLLNTSSMLFMEYGYEAVSLQQIAKACGVTKASIYYYYSGKPQLFTASVTMVMRRARDKTEALLAQKLPIRERLVQLAEVKLLRPHADFETIMREARPSLTEDQLSEITAMEDSIHECLADHLSLAMQQGHLRSADALLTAHALSAVLMLGNREIAKGTSPHQLAREIVDLFWDGLSPQ